MAHFSFIEWLTIWLFESNDLEFEWDIGNLSKSATKHQVLPNEVEDVFRIKMTLPLGLQVSPVVPEERYAIVGQTTKGRVLMIMFTLREDKVRPISARPASKKERQIYEAFIRKIT